VSRSDDDPTEQQYVADLLRCYILLPHTSNRPSRNDRRIATQLFNRRVPLDAIKTAFVLAISRRTFRSPDAPPLEPIRSLAYLLPVVNEVQNADLDPAYIELLKRRLETDSTHTHCAQLFSPIPW
jgi:hypothetical protein